MQNYFIIYEKLPSLNDYIDECRTNKYRGANFKKDVENIISIYIRNAKVKKTVTPTDKPIIVHFEWHERTKKRDTDNVASAKKFILDAMQSTGIIPNDSRKYVKGFTDMFFDAKSDYVVVKIEEIAPGETV